MGAGAAAGVAHLADALVAGAAVALAVPRREEVGALVAARKEGRHALRQTARAGAALIQGAARAARRAAHQLARHGPAWKRASLPREKDSARVVRFLTAPTTGAAAATKAFKSSELRAGSCTLER